MTDDDFYNYYIIPCRSLSVADDWEVHCVFPAEASFTEAGKRKAINALYRLFKCGIVEFWLGDLSHLEKAPLNSKIKTDYDYATAWMGILLRGTDSFIEHEAEALGIPYYETDPISPDFRKNLEELFQKNGVGFEKEDVYPPYLE